MRIETATQEDIALGLEPCFPPVVTVAVTASLTLRVEFADGVVGEVRFLPSHLTGVFEALKDPAFFVQARAEHGAVTWPGELDLAPDAMYEAVKHSGSWVLQ